MNIFLEGVIIIKGVEYRNPVGFIKLYVLYDKTFCLGNWWAANWLTRAELNLTTCKVFNNSGVLGHLRQDSMGLHNTILNCDLSNWWWWNKCHLPNYAIRNCVFTCFSPFSTAMPFLSCRAFRCMWNNTSLGFTLVKLNLAGLKGILRWSIDSGGRRSWARLGLSCNQ